MATHKLTRSVSGIDAAFLYLERKEIPLHIAGVCVFEDEIPMAEFVRSIDSKLHLLPRYRQLISDPPFHLGYPTWEDDPRFDIKRHIFHAQVDAPGGKAEFEALASRILSQVMDRGKPLWDIHVIDGLKGGKGAIIARVHHALADGVAGASIMKIILDPTPEGSRAGKKPPYRPNPPSSGKSIAEALASGVRSSLENMIGAEAVMLDFLRTLLDDRTKDALQKFVGLLPELAASSERFVFNKPCCGERKFCWTEFPIRPVQEIRDAIGGTANDVILTIVTRAVSRYVQYHGERVRGRFVIMMCPVNVRQDNGESLGNRISFMPVVLPLDIADPIRLLHAVAERTQIMKNARAAHLVSLLTCWIGSMPPPLQAMFWAALPQIPLPVPLLHMICTNVPGSPDPLYAVGRKMTACYPHVPTGYELGVNCAFQSYDGNFYGGLTADANVVSDAERLRDLMHASFLELKRAALPRTRPAAASAPKARRRRKPPEEPPKAPEVAPAAGSETEAAAAVA